MSDSYTDISKVTPCLLFDNNAQEVARFYRVICPNSAIGRFSVTVK
ncbi:VOC family protein [Undibacterium sp. TJN25]